jgi:hypothetical protein
MPQVSLAGPVPGKIADLYSLTIDLDHVGRLARLSVDAATRYEGDDLDPDDRSLVRAYWEAALIGYRRCFTTGKAYLVPRQGRPSLDDLVSSLDDRLQTAHRRFLTQADRHVAHRVSELQQITVTAVLTAPPLSPAADGIVCLVAHFVAPEPDDAHAMQKLAEVIGARLREEMYELMDLLREDCDGRLLWCYENAVPRLDDRIRELAAERDESS